MFELAQNVHVISSIFMTGVICMVQVVQYPGFALVGSGEFAKFHEHHSRRITFIVFPAMLIELVTSFAFGWDVRLLTISAWLLTAFVAMPIHTRLGTSVDSSREALVQKLVATNWLRTLLWIGKSAYLLVGSSLQSR